MFLRVKNAPQKLKGVLGSQCNSIEATVESGNFYCKVEVARVQSSTLKVEGPWSLLCTSRSSKVAREHTGGESVLTATMRLSALPRY